MQDINSKDLNWDAKRRAWNEVIEDFNSSGQNQTLYCKQRNINKDQFCYYLSRWRKANRNDNSQNQTRMSFLPVEINSPQGKCMLNIGNGVSLELPDGISIEHLSALILNLRKNLC